MGILLAIMMKTKRENWMRLNEYVCIVIYALRLGGSSYLWMVNSDVLPIKLQVSNPLTFL